MLYHKDLGFPNTLVMPSGVMFLEYSNHALRASKNDRYTDSIHLPKAVTIDFSKIVEVETPDNINVTKIVLRIKYSTQCDLCLVILPETFVVKTVWLNRNDDTHFTLDVTKYTKLK